MNKKDIFKATWRTFITRATPPGINRDTSACVYKDGCSCAVGNLIPDHLYDPKMEGETVGALFKKYPALAAHLGEENLGLLISLQFAHDQSAHDSDNNVGFREIFREKLESIGYAIGVRKGKV